jgi:hypothetical protein
MAGSLMNMEKLVEREPAGKTKDSGKTFPSTTLSDRRATLTLSVYEQECFYVYLYLSWLYVPDVNTG